MLLIVLHYQSTSLILNKTRNYFKQRILTKKIVFIFVICIKSNFCKSYQMKSFRTRKFIPTKIYFLKEKAKRHFKINTESVLHQYAQHYLNNVANQLYLPHHHNSNRQPYI